MSSKGSSGPEPLSHVVLGKVSPSGFVPSHLHVLQGPGPHPGKKDMLGEGKALGFILGVGGGVCSLSCPVRGRSREGKARSCGLQTSKLAAISNLPPEL